MGGDVLTLGTFTIALHTHITAHASKQWTCAGARAVHTLGAQNSPCVALPLQTAEVLYKKRQKKEAPKGWESFNQHTLFRGYEKRSDKIEPDMEVRAMLLTYTRHACAPSAGSVLAARHVGMLCLMLSKHRNVS